MQNFILKFIKTTRLWHFILKIWTAEDIRYASKLSSIHFVNHKLHGFTWWFLRVASTKFLIRFAYLWHIMFLSFSLDLSRDNNSANARLKCISLTLKLDELSDLISLNLRCIRSYWRQQHNDYIDVLIYVESFQLT